MGKLMNQSPSVALKGASNFGFSGIKPDQLGATEYTLAEIDVDVSSSVRPFANQLADAIKVILEASQKNPRSLNMLLRVATFADDVVEVHGFNELAKISASDYSLNPYGSTALFDASLAGLEALAGYGKTLYDLDYTVNALQVVITDGEENVSRVGTTAKIKKQKEKIQHDEQLESVKTILIGIGGASTSYLDQFKTDAGFDDLIMVGDATAGNLAKMADFVSRSISSSSQALGTGGPSQNLSF